MEILFLKIRLSVFLVKIAIFEYAIQCAQKKKEYVIQNKLPQFSQNPRNFDWNSGFIDCISRTVYFNDEWKGKKKGGLEFNFTLIGYRFNQKWIFGNMSV